MPRKKKTTKKPRKKPSEPRYKLEVEARVNGRLGKSHIVVMVEDGRVITDAADLNSMPERHKVAIRFGQWYRCGRFQAGEAPREGSCGGRKETARTPPSR